MTFEEFVDETEKLIEQAEDERKETEAIMNAPPNADFLDEEDDVKKEDKSPVASLESYEQVAASDEFEEMLMKMGGADETSEGNWSDDILMKIAAEDRDEDIAGTADDDDVSVSDIDVLEMDTLEVEEDSELATGSMTDEQS